MGSLRATLRAATLANSFLGYIVTVILIGYGKGELVILVKSLNYQSINLLHSSLPLVNL